MAGGGGGQLGLGAQTTGDNHAGDGAGCGGAEGAGGHGRGGGRQAKGGANGSEGVHFEGLDLNGKMKEWSSLVLVL